MLERLANTGGPDLADSGLAAAGMYGIESADSCAARRTKSHTSHLDAHGAGSQADIVEGLSSGANDYVTKPYDSAVLIRARHQSVSHASSELCRRRPLIRT
jgi:DNA-binding response OmpR family regulator